MAFELPMQLAGVETLDEAGQARLLEESDSDRVVVEASDASVDEVLAVLAVHFGFAVERTTPSAETVDTQAIGRGTTNAVISR